METEDSDAVYKVINTDLRMGRIKMRKMAWRFGWEGDEFDSYEEALDALEDKTGERNASEIEEYTEGDAFWMDYREVFMHY